VQYHQLNGEEHAGNGVVGVAVVLEAVAHRDLEQVRLPRCALRQQALHLGRLAAVDRDLGHGFPLLVIVVVSAAPSLAPILAFSHFGAQPTRVALLQKPRRQRAEVGWTCATWYVLPVCEVGRGFLVLIVTATLPGGEGCRRVTIPSPGLAKQMPPDLAVRLHREHGGVALVVQTSGIDRAGEVTISGPPNRERRLKVARPVVEQIYQKFVAAEAATNLRPGRVGPDLPRGGTCSGAYYVGWAELRSHGTQYATWYAWSLHRSKFVAGDQRTRDALDRLFDEVNGLLASQRTP
jgi:hypothetical protein